MPLAQQPFLYRENKHYACNKIFPVLLTMKRMNTDTKLWGRFITELLILLEIS